MPKAKSSRAIGCLQKSEISNIKPTKNEGSNSCNIKLNLFSKAFPFFTILADKKSYKLKFK